MPLITTPKAAAALGRLLTDHVVLARPTDGEA